MLEAQPSQQQEEPEDHQGDAHEVGERVARVAVIGRVSIQLFGSDFTAASCGRE